MSYQDDSQQIRRMLEDRIEQVLDSIAPGWVQRRGVAYLTPKGPKDLGSFTVQLRTGGKMPRGTWYRFSQNIGGGSVELVAYQMCGRKDAYREAFAWSREFLGIAREQISDEERREREQRRAVEEARRQDERAAHAAEEARRREARVLTVQDIWSECRPLLGTLGDGYLQARGLPPVSEWPWSPDDAIRFHPGIAHERARSSGKFPAVVGKVVDAWGDHVALKLILLDRDQPRKCTALPDGEDPKPTMGPAKGGAVRIGGDGPKVGMGEGLETCLAAWVLENYRFPVWAGLSTAGVANWEPPLFVKCAPLYPDGDAGKFTKQGDLLDPPGMVAAKTLRARLVPTGIKAPIQDMCLLGDALDLLVTRRKHEKQQPI